MAKLGDGLRVIALLAMVAVALGTVLVHEMVQDSVAANTTYRTLPTASPTPQPVRLANLSGPNLGTSNNSTVISPGLLQLRNPTFSLPSVSTTYVLDEYDGRVTVVDTDTKKALRAISVGQWPTDMAWSQAKSRLYVVNSYSDTLSVIDTTIDAKTGEIDLMFPNPEHIAVSPDGSKVYVTAFNSVPSYNPPELKRPDGCKCVLITVDAASGRVSNAVSLPFTAGPMAISPDGSRLYVLSGTDFGVLDTNTWKILKAPRPFIPPTKDFTVDFGGDSTALALSPDGKWLYVTNTSRYKTIDNGYGGMPARLHFVDIDQVDAATFQVMRTVQLTYNGTEIPHDASQWGGLGGLGGGQSISKFTADGIAVSPDGWLVVVTSYVDGTGNFGTMNALYNENGGLSWAGTYAISSATPEGVAFSPDGRTICLANGAEQSCSLIETGMGKETRIPVGANPGTNADQGTIKVVTRPGPIGTSGAGLISTVNNMFGHAAATVMKKGQMPASMQAPPSTENGTLYVCNNQSDSISAIDLATEQVNATIDVYKSPDRAAVTPAGTKVFAIDHVLPSSALSVIDAGSGQVVKTVENPLAEYVDVLASPDGSAIYLSTEEWSSAIAVIDPATGSLKRSIHLPQGSYIFNHMAVSPKGRFLYLTYDDRMLVYDVINDKVRGKVDFVGDGAAVSAPDGSVVYVASHSLGIVLPVDTVTLKPLYQRAILVSSPGDMAVSPDGKRLYIISTNDNSLIVADPVAGNIVDTVDLTSQNFPSSLHSDRNSVAVSPNGTRVYVTNPAYGTVWVIDAASDYIIKSIKVGNGPEGMAVRSASDRTYKGSPESLYMNPSLSLQATTGYVIPTLRQLQVGDTPVTLQSNQIRTGDGSNISLLVSGGTVLVPASSGGMSYYNVTTGDASGDAAQVRAIRLEIGKQVPIESGGVKVVAEAVMNAVPVDASIDISVLPPDSVDLTAVNDALNQSEMRLSGEPLAAIEVNKTGLENGKDIGSVTLTFQLSKPADFDPMAHYFAVRFDGSAREVLGARYLGEGENSTISFEVVSPHGFSTFTLVEASGTSAAPPTTATGGNKGGLCGILAVLPALGLGLAALSWRRKSGR